MTFTSSCFSIVLDRYSAASTRFPSPAGSSCFSIKPYVQYGHDAEPFPSPAGSSCFSIGRILWYSPIIMISVPCGVFVFLNISYIVSDGEKFAISVPCGVFVFLNTLFHGKKEDSYIISVPCGVFVFLNANNFRYGTNLNFRPLRGLRVSQSCQRENMRSSSRISVPCGVFVFLNLSDVRRRNREVRFPSPAGSSCFSIYKI